MMLQFISSVLLVQKTILTILYLILWNQSMQLTIFVTLVTSSSRTLPQSSKMMERTLLYLFSIFKEYMLNLTIDNLSSMGLYFGAICLQETWLSSDADVSLLQIPGYKLIHQGSRCTRHGGLVIYLHEQYTYKLRNMYTRSDIWGGLFIDVSGHNLRRPITIGNIYWPPHNNNNNANIETFIEEMSPKINTLQKKNKCATIVGDFNINLLQIN